MNIKVFKFGGASLRDAKSIKNMLEIVKKEKGSKVCIVASAMGKTTNAFEAFLENYWQKRAFEDKLQAIEAYHFQIAEELFEKNHVVFDSIRQVFEQLEDRLKSLEGLENFDKTYDQIVSFGELLSTTILQAFLVHNSLKCAFLDARAVIRTNSHWREGEVSWAASQKLIQENANTLFQKEDFILSQGFVAGNNKGETTTLGREGSDFSSAIFAQALRAQSLTIWKDVDGVLNADPRKFPEALLFDQLSYKEAALMSKYGASVIHPKTIAPLSSKTIPLFVKPFFKPSESGTVIHSESSEKKVPILISKEKQVLIDFEAKTFSFFSEKDLAFIMSEVVKHKIKINLLHKSATNCIICANDYPRQVADFVKKLKEKYHINIQRRVALLTVLNGSNSMTERLLEGKRLVLKEEHKDLFQAVVSEG